MIPIYLIRLDYPGLPTVQGNRTFKIFLEEKIMNCKICRGEVQLRFWQFNCYKKKSEAPIHNLL